MIENFEFIKNTIFNLIEFTFEKKIEVTYFDGLKVVFDGEKAIIGCNNKTTLARGFFILAREYRNEPFEIEERARFDTLCAMLDMSRNGVMKVSGVKKYIDNLAALGYNAFALYTEDTFEMKKYPRFGYQRGRYTLDELKEIGDYAFDLGIDVIPSIESLGHMGQYLKWSEANNIKDTAEVLLVDEEKTYEFLEEELKTMRYALRSKFIFIHLDEARDLGMGKFYDLHGYENRMQIFLRHLNKVYDLCKKYGFKPVVDSDMFFSIASKNHAYYDEEAEITEEIRKNIPDVLINYWDYYHTDKSTYDLFMDKHKQFKKELVFFGSIWTWEGFIEDTEFTVMTSIPAIQSCLDNNIKFVVVSMWGDNGSETNIMHTVGSLPIFSEYCYKGNNCTMKHIETASEFLTKMPFAHKLEISKIHSNFHDDSKISKKIFYSDIFYNLVDMEYDFDKVMMDFKEGLFKTEEYLELKDRHYEYYKYCNLFFKCVIAKFDVLNNIQKKYKENDRIYLKEVAYVTIPQLILDYKEFHKAFREDWLRDKKPNGLEVMNIRLGGIITQMEYVAERINDYIEGKIKIIDELEYEFMTSGVKTYLCFKDLVTPSNIF